MIHNTVSQGGVKMISIDYKDQKSIHEQIEAKIKELIVSGILKPEEKLPSVRELSITLTVNPNTVQKAYKQLESDGYIYSVKGKGNFVCSPKELKKEADYDSLYKELTNIIKELHYLGENEEKIENVIRNIYREEK